MIREASSGMSVLWILVLPLWPKWQHGVSYQGRGWSEDKSYICPQTFTSDSMASSKVRKQYVKAQPDKCSVRGIPGPWFSNWFYWVYIWHQYFSSHPFITLSSLPFMSMQLLVIQYDKNKKIFRFIHTYFCFPVRMLFTADFYNRNSQWWDYQRLN